MKKHFLKKHEENWLRIPYEENADPCIITISDSTGKKETIQMKVSKTRVDYWMAYPLKDFFGDDIQAEGPASRGINAIELSDDPEKQRRRELSKSVIHYMPPTGCIRELNSVKKAGEQWVLDCATDPCSLTGNEENQTAMRLVSKDLLHNRQSASPHGAVHLHSFLYSFCILCFQNQLFHIQICRDLIIITGMSRHSFYIGFCHNSHIEM